MIELTDAISLQGRVCAKLVWGVCGSCLLDSNSLPVLALVPLILL